MRVGARIGPSRRILSSPHYKWWAYAAIGVGMFVTVMDQSGVSIALPRIAERFSADLPTVQWITLGYVLSTAAMLMPMGRLSDMLGRKPVYLAGLVVFMAAAALGGSAQSFGVIIAAKVVQGIGAAAIQANGLAMIAQVFPENERGKGFGMYMAVIGAGSIGGPVIGGLLVSALGWRSVFFASVPLGLLAVGMAVAILRGNGTARTAGRGKLGFDWPGASLSSASLVSFLLAATNGHRLGWDSPAVVAGLTIATLLMGVFLWWEGRADDPMLDLNFFRSKVFSMGVSARFLSFVAGSSVFFLMPFYLIVVLGNPASRAGLMLVPGSVAMAVMGPVSGLLADRVGTRWLSVLGMGLSASAMFIFSRLTVDSSWVHVVVGMVLSGSGMGIFSSSNTTAIMGSMDRERYGIVSAFLNLTRTSANVTGVVLATTIVALTMGSMGYEPTLAAVSESEGGGVKAAFVSGLSKAYLTGAGIVLAALVLSALRGEAPAPRPEPAPVSSPTVED